MATGTGLAAFEGAPGRIEVFEYPAGPEWAEVQAWDGWADAGQAGSSAPVAPAANDSGAEDVKAGLHAEFDRRMAEETRKAFESGRERGLKEGRQAEREAQTAGREGAERQRVRQGVELVERFAQQRENYLRAVEREVVELALAVAARILRREAQMDPLLLTGAVRVALGQLSGATEVRLKVPASELELWTEAIGLVPNLAVKPTLAAGEGMRLGDCTIETDLGSVDLGIRAQLGEIERGFFDRAGGPRAQAAGPAQGAEGGGREGGA
jgi:flagellar assembly protein FliH